MDQSADQVTLTFFLYTIMSYIFSKQSIEALERCQTDLQRIVESSLERSQIDFAVVEGHRSVARQQLYLVPTEDALHSKNL